MFLQWALTNTNWSLDHYQLGVLIETMGCFVEHTPKKRIVLLFIRERRWFQWPGTQRRLQNLAGDMPFGRVHDRHTDQNFLNVSQSHFRLSSVPIPDTLVETRK